MTTAQQVANQFITSTHTVSIATLARHQDATVYKQWQRIVYEFADGSSLITTGRGRSHKITVLDK